MKQPEFVFAHLGMNLDTPEASMEVAEALCSLFGFSLKEGNSSNFAGPNIEVTKKRFPGVYGHIGIGTPDVAAAKAWLEEKGLQFRPETAKEKDGVLTAIYLKQEIAGFAVHLVKKEI